MPLSFSSMLFSNSVAMCSNLNPDFLSQKFGLISLKFFRSPKISLSSSSLLIEKGKGADGVSSVRGLSRYERVSMICDKSTERLPFVEGQVEFDWSIECDVSSV